MNSAEFDSSFYLERSCFIFVPVRVSMCTLLWGLARVVSVPGCFQDLYDSPAHSVGLDYLMRTLERVTLPASEQGMKADPSCILSINDWFQANPNFHALPRTAYEICLSVLCSLVPFQLIIHAVFKLFISICCLSNWLVMLPFHLKLLPPQ